MMFPSRLRQAVLTCCVTFFTLGWLSAAPLEAAKVPGKGKNNAQAQAGTATLITELQATRRLLEQADHDYKGHRSAAVHQIIHAIHLLEHHKHHPNAASQTAHLKRGQPGSKESQQFSDQTLQQAIQQLQTIGGQMQQLGSTQKHHQHAQTAVQRAIQDLQAALKVI